jgi:hypothetical protein
LGDTGIYTYEYGEIVMKVNLKGKMFEEWIVGRFHPFYRSLGKVEV